MTEPARRDRHRAEIAAAVAAGQRDRADVLACEHLVEFPDDIQAITELLATPAEPPSRR